MRNVLLVLFLAATLVACTNGGANSMGTLRIGLTDAPAGLNIEKVDVTISSVQVHVADNDSNGTNSSGWQTVVSGPLTYDLIQLKNVTTIIGSEQLPAGKYTQIRLTVDKATVTIGGNAQELTIPSGVIKLTHEFTIDAGRTTTLTLDFNAQESVNTAGGKYIMRPTIKVLQQ